MMKQELHKVLLDAIALPAENEIVEFKTAKDGFDFDKIGQYFSALSNEAKKERFFPMPDYDISDENRARVTILGEIINDNYSRLLKKHPELSLDDVIALDRVQKKLPVSEADIQRLQELKLVAGLASELQVAGNYTKISYQDYKQMILNLITQNGSATRDDIVNLIMPTLSPDEPMEKRLRKITNIVARLSKQEKIIKNISNTDKYPVWKLVGEVLNKNVDVKMKSRCKKVLMNININTIRTWTTIFLALLMMFSSCNSKNPDDGNTSKPASITSLTINGQQISNGGKTARLSIEEPVTVDIDFSIPVKFDYWDSEKIFILNINPSNYEVAQGDDDKHIVLIINYMAFKSYSSYKFYILAGEYLGVEIEDAFSCTLLTDLNYTPKFPTISDDELLTLVQRQTFKYFWDFGHPASGMARERNTSGNTVTTGGTGFGVMAMIVAVEREFVSRNDAVARIQTIVSFLKNNCTTYHGAFAHWINGQTGATQPFSTKDNGADLVETSFLMQGLLTARQYFSENVPAETQLREDITALWEAVEWDWFRRDGQNVLYWHWSANYGWEMNHQVRGWNECLMTYVLAASSPTHTIPKVVYDEGWARNGGMKNGASYYGYMLPLGEKYGGPLFFAHYSFLGLNPKNLSDAYCTDYWEQNANHALINYHYCVQNPLKYVGYSADCWGLTASDGNQGYSAHSPTNDKGVITPTAALSSMPYTPDESMQALHFFYYMLGDMIWKEYGFTDAFNPTVGWYDNQFLAIDQGPVIVMIENYRTELIWNLLMSCSEVQEGLTKLGFINKKL
jgi:hypothetical protein